MNSDDGTGRSEEVLRPFLGVIGRFADGTDNVIGALIEVHRHLGPGLLESAYEACVCAELRERGLEFERQRPPAQAHAKSPQVLPLFRPSCAIQMSRWLRRNPGHPLKRVCPSARSRGKPPNRPKPRSTRKDRRPTSEAPSLAC